MEFTMTSRIISASPSEVRSFNSRELIESIALSEGRTLLGECICTCEPHLYGITNAEIVGSMGCDIILLNMYDVFNPVIKNLPECDNPILKLKELTGRPIGINLEPVEDMENTDKLWKMSKGRLATKENAKVAKESGVDIICITGNPGNHVTNEAIYKAIKEIRDELKDEIVIISGKMHASGSLKEAGENIITLKDVDNFIDAGADVILLPAPGTVPGITVEMIRNLVSHIHSRDKLALTAIGTSQEGSDTETLKSIALMAKQTGTDIHHIGDSGYTGVCPEENYVAYSIAIRGIRHTYHKIAQSINR